ncbi:efflux RND transporter periplasmic adaptor subunit [Pseudomonas quasicaspiana]|nr:efflux RND transporter periplasmic adaptor subunit [Pseudomonas quasicaspiana]
MKVTVIRILLICKVWLFCIIFMMVAGCRDKPVREVVERPVLFIEMVDAQQHVHGRFAGSIQPRYEVELGFRVAGRIATRQVEIGDRVRRGDLLATLEPSGQQNQLRARQAELNKAQATWQQLSAERQRYQQLIEQGVGAQARLDQMSGDLQTQDAMLSQARNALQQATDHLSYTRLLAEFDGVVTDWHGEVGQVVATGHPVVSLARPESREAVVDLPLDLVATLNQSIRIQVISQLNPQAFVAARVRQLSPQIDPMTRTQRVRLTLDAVPDSFRLGSTVSIEISSVADSFRELPGSAVLEREGQARVWVIDPQSATLSSRDVTILARHGASVRVEGELRDGDKVVIAGVNGLRAGQRVRMDREVSL